MKISASLVLSSLFLLLPAQLSAITTLNIFDESSLSSGEISNDFANPTNFDFQLGVNRVIGNAGDNGQSGGANASSQLTGIDADFFSVTIQEGQQLSAIFVQSFNTTPFLDGALSFIGFTNGSAFNAPLNVSTTDLAGFTLFNEELVFNPDPDLRNLLTDSISTAPSLNSGAPLTAGTYTFLVQETTSALEVDYSLDFIIEPAPVPEPSSTALFALSSLALLTRRKRRS